MNHKQNKFNRTTKNFISDREKKFAVIMMKAEEKDKDWGRRKQRIHVKNETD